MLASSPLLFFRRQWKPELLLMFARMQLGSFLCDETNQSELRCEHSELCNGTPRHVGIETHQAKVTAEMRLGLNELMAFKRDKDKRTLHIISLLTKRVKKKKKTQPLDSEVNFVNHKSHPSDVFSCVTLLPTSAGHEQKSEECGRMCGKNQRKWKHATQWACR